MKKLFIPLISSAIVFLLIFSALYLYKNLTWEKFQSNTGCISTSASKIEENNTYLLNHPSEKNCEKIKTLFGCAVVGIGDRGKCYLNLYKNTKNIKYCDKIISLAGDDKAKVNEIVECYKLAGENYNDICSKINKYDEYDEYKECLNLLNLPLNLTETICNTFSQGDYSHPCYKDLAIQTGKINFCKSDKDSSYIKNRYTVACVIRTAIKHNNSKICENLKGNCWFDGGGSFATGSLPDYFKSLIPPTCYEYCLRMDGRMNF